MIEMTEQPIDEQAVLAAVADPDCGAQVLFTGTTRRLTRMETGDQVVDRETVLLEYECYQEMAIAKILELSQQAKQRWPVRHVAIVHRVGKVDVGETSIAVAVSSGHRVDAFSAASWLVDELKRQVPIWKREIWADGNEEWVHPTTGEVDVQSCATNQGVRSESDEARLP